MSYKQQIKAHFCRRLKWNDMEPGVKFDECTPEEKKLFRKIALDTMRDAPAASVEHFSEAIGVSEKTIRRWKRGRR